MIPTSGPHMRVHACDLEHLAHCEDRVCCCVTQRRNTCSPPCPSVCLHELLEYLNETAATQDRVRGKVPGENCLPPQREEWLYQHSQLCDGNSDTEQATSTDKARKFG